MQSACIEGCKSSERPGCWYLVISKSRQESIACEQLGRQGFEAYFPRASAPRLRGGRWLSVVEPLFPRYLFVRARGAERSLNPIRYTRGVLAMVRSGVEFARVTDELIAELRSREDSATGLHHVYICAPFRPGQRVTVVGGPLAGLEGIFRSLRGHDRVVLLLKMLGTEASVVVPAGLVAVS